MKKSVHSLLLPALALSLLLLASCKQDYTGKEKTHPLFVKAGTAQASEQYAEAAKLYEEFLLIAPKSAETHMKLASLYGDSLDEPLKAVYHYEKVIALRPEDTTNNGSIREFIAVAKKRLLDKLKEEHRDVAAENAMKAELEATRKRLESYVTAYQQIKQKLIAARERILQANAIVKRQNQRRASGSVNTGGASRKPASIKPAAGSAGTGVAPSAKFHKVQSGDSLYKISRKYYGTSKYARKIAELNNIALPAMRIRVGQNLKLPVVDNKAK